MSPDEQVALANGLMKNHIHPALGENQGAALFVFTYGEGGLTSYIGTASRESLLKALKEMIAKWEEEARQELLKPTDGSIQVMPEELEKTKFDPTNGGRDKETLEQMMAIEIRSLKDKHGSDRNALYHAVRNANPDLHDLRVYDIMEEYIVNQGKHEFYALVHFVRDTILKRVQS